MNISAPAYEKYKKSLWNLSYRITGNAADSEDIIQETFLRFVQKPPQGNEDELKPWLMRVATNLSIDKLRQRKRRQESNGWLPSPVPDDYLDLTLQSKNPSARYDFNESLSFAFLLAMEALSPSQTTASFVNLNGEPSVLFERKNVREGHATRFTLHCQADENGTIERLNFVFAPGKLTLVPDVK